MLHTIKVILIAHVYKKGPNFTELSKAYTYILSKQIFKFYICFVFLECPFDHYKSEDSSVSSCTTCPDNSHTVSTNSNSVLQCLCDYGYEGPDGGPCTSKCILLSPFYAWVVHS